MTSTASPLATLAKESETTFILALFVDLTGKPCAKLVPVEAVEELAREGVGFAGYAAGAMGQEPKDPDIMAIPDPASFTPVPFVKEGLALVHCDPHVEGEPWRFAPRVILRRMIERAAERDLSVYLGAEIEYFLVAKDERGALVTADPSDSAARPCYDARGVTRMFDHLASVSTAMNQLGWGNYANDHEDGNGQFEQNFDYADVLTTADRVITARYLISMLAEQRGMTATFMPKPFGDRTGSGLHMHLSLWKDDEPLFPAADDPRGSASRSWPTRRSPASSSTRAPCRRSSRRPSTPTSAPARSRRRRVRRGRRACPPTAATTAPTWCGCPTATASSCAAATAPPTHTSRRPARSARCSTASSVASTPGAPGGSDDADRAPLPLTLLHAVEALEADPAVSGVLDSVGPDVARYFADLKREEFFTWHSR
ncbi:MAG: hypothetical protein PGN15_00295 [Aeromicrobium erythreum]